VLPKKLSVRIALVFALSILVIEVGVVLFTVFQEQDRRVDQKVELLNLVTNALQGDFTRSIKAARYQSLSETVLEITRAFQANSLVIFDPSGHILDYEKLNPNADAKMDDLKYQLQKSLVQKTPQVKIFNSNYGSTLRYVAAIHDAEGQTVAGLEIEMPLQTIHEAIGAYVLKTMWVVLVLVLFVTALATYVLILMVVDPINEMKKEFIAVAQGEGDLTRKVRIRSRDEIGETGQWFNSFVDKVRDMVAVIRDHSERLLTEVQAMTHSTAEVSAMSEDVATTIQQIAKGAEEQASKIGDVHHLMQEMQESMKEVEKKAKETASAADQATQTAQAGGQLVQETIDHMVQLNENILKNSELVHHLGEKSQQIIRVVEIISGIAEQTNLLSLNAAIEAARAGEQGKGFAVVADEIRSLADGASKASHEIEDLIEQIQQQTHSTVQSMEASAKEAEQSRGGIRMMGDALKDIIRVIEDVQGQSQAITELAAVQTQRYTKIVNGIQDINAVSEESAASTEEVSASTEEQTASMEQVNATCRELSQMAQDMKSMVEKFKIR